MRLLELFAILKTSLRSRMGALAWGVAVVFVIQRFADVANLVVKLVLGRLLPPLEFGAIEPIYSTLAVLALPVAIVFGAAVKSISRLLATGQEAQCRRLVRHLVILATCGSLLSAVVVLCLRHIILTRLHLESPVFIWVIVLLFALTWWTPLTNALLRARQHYGYLTVPWIVAPLAVLILTVVLVNGLGLGLRGAVLARAGGALLTILLLAPFLVRSCSGPTASYTEELKIFTSILFPMSILFIVNTVGMHFDRLFVRNFLVEDSGGYGAIIMLGQIPALLIGPILFVALPLASAQHAEGRQLVRFYRGTMGLAALATLASAVLFGIAAAPLFRLWQPAFIPYARYVWVYALGTGLLSMLTVSAQVEMARHRYRFLWFHAIPILGFSGLLYGMQHGASLPFVLYGLTASRALALILVLLYIRYRRA